MLFFFLHPSFHFFTFPFELTIGTCFCNQSESLQMPPWNLTSNLLAVRPFFKNWNMLHFGLLRSCDVSQCEDKIIAEERNPLPFETHSWWNIKTATSVATNPILSYAAAPFYPPTWSSEAAELITSGEIIATGATRGILLFSFLRLLLFLPSSANKAILNTTRFLAGSPWPVAAH